MTCTRYQELLSRYVDDEVTPRQRRELLAHVENCRDCSAWLARVRQADVLLKGVPETHPSDRVRETVLTSALKAKNAAEGGSSPPHRHGAPVFGHSGRSEWQLATAELLMRFEISPQRVMLAVVAAVLSIVGLAYSLNILPPLWGYQQFGFLFPGDTGEVAAAPAPLPAISSGPSGVGGPVAMPNLIRIVPANHELNISPTDTLSVRFDQPMDRASVEGALQLNPPAAGKFNWDADNEVSFSPTDAGLLRGITYTVTLTNSARSLAGTPMGSPLAWSFHTVNPYTVTPGLASGSQVSVMDDFTLQFDTPMDTSEAGRAIQLRATGSSVDVPVSLAWDADGKRLTISPVSPMPEGDVTLRVGQEARTRHGETLGQSTQFVYIASLPLPRLRLLQGRVVVTGAANAVPIRYEALGEHGTLDKLSFALYEFPGDKLSALSAQTGNWPAALPGGFPAGLSPVKDGSVHRLNDAANPEASGWVMSGLVPGSYLLVASARAGSEVLTDWQLVLAADSGLKLAGDSGPLWATGNDGKAWVGAEVSLYSPTGALLEKGLTDANGLWQPPEKASGATLAIARDLQGHLAALAGERLLNGYPSTFISQPLSIGLLFPTFHTDLASYYPGQTINFRVLLRPENMSALAATPDTEQDVSVVLLNPPGAVLSTLTLKPDSVGAVSGLFNLAPAASPGQYTVRVKQGDKGRDFPIIVKTSRQDGLSVYLALDRGSKLGSEQAITYTVSVLAANGEPAADAQLTSTLGIVGEDWSSPPMMAVTDSRGRATLVVPLPDWAWNGRDYYDPGLYLKVRAGKQAAAGQVSVPLDLIPQTRLLSGVRDLVSPSLNITAYARDAQDGTLFMRLVTLDQLASQSVQGELLVRAVSPTGAQQVWSLDMMAAGNDVTLPLKGFEGGTVYFFRSDVPGSRQLQLLPAHNPQITLTVNQPYPVEPNEPFETALALTDKAGSGIEGVASVWFRRVSGDLDGAIAAPQSWEPSVRLGPTGTTVATLTAPSEPGLWYVLCSASTLDGFDVQTWSVIDVQPGPTIQVPLILQGLQDQAQDFAVTIYNPSDTPLSTGIAADAVGPLEVLGSSSHGVEVPAHGWQRLSWRVIPRRQGVAALRFSFSPSAGVGGVWPLYIKSTENISANSTHVSGVLTGQRTVGVQVPSGLSDNNVQLEIHASSSLLSALVDAASVGQPSYADSVPAWAAALSAKPSIAAAYNRAGLGIPQNSRLSSLERSLILQQLYASQHPDGGWGAGLDPAAGMSSPNVTADVLLALHRQTLAWSQVGVEPQPEVDGSVIDMALAYLLWQSMQPVEGSSSGSMLDERARSFYALSLYGRIKPDKIRPLMANATIGDAATGPALSREGQAWLALALWQSGDKDDAFALVDRLLLSPPTAQDATSSAPILEALVEMAPTVGANNLNLRTQTLTFAQARAYARSLMEARQGGGWSSASASADALGALADYADGEAEKAAGSPTLTLNDNTLQVSAQPDNAGTVSVILSGSTLHAGTNWLKLQASLASQPLYYSLVLRASR